jgi:ankyrin repeat protein
LLREGRGGLGCNRENEGKLTKKEGRIAYKSLLLASLSCYQHPDLIRFLLTRGAERNIRDHGGFSPAELARNAGRLDIFRLITEYPKIMRQAAFAFTAEEARKQGEPGLGELPPKMVYEIGKYVEE